MLVIEVVEHEAVKLHKRQVVTLSAEYLCREHSIVVAENYVDLDEAPE